MAVPPDLDRLRAYVKGEPGSEAGGYLAARFLLSVLDEGGKLVVETPCEHGSAVRHRISKALPHVMCPGGSRSVVWPTDKEKK
jgi:hypothetical protein